MYTEDWSGQVDEDTEERKRVLYVAMQDHNIDFVEMNLVEVLYQVLISF